MEKLLRAGSFREMVVRGREVYVAEREPEDAHFGETSCALSRIEPDGDMHELDRRPDPWICDLAATSTSLVWTEQNHRMQASWRRAVCVIDLDDPKPVTRKLIPEESMRLGVHSDGQGGVVVSMGVQIARIPPGAPAKLVNIVEATPYTRIESRAFADQVTFANGIAVDGDWLIWSTRFDKGGLHIETKEQEPDHPTRLLRAPLRGGGPIEVLREAHKEDIRLLGAVDGTILFQSEDGEILLREKDGRLRSVLGDAPGTHWDPVVRTRAVRGDLWMHPASNSTVTEQCVSVLRRGKTTIEKLPFEAIRFDITEDAIYRLTERGVYVTRVQPWGFFSSSIR